MYYIHADHLNTPQVVTDDTQTVVWKGEYTPFGEVEEVVSTIEFNLRFPGQFYDAETGLNYNYFRSYNPATGRYMSTDPLGIDGGFNLFAYVDNNPLSWVDLYGLAKLPSDPSGLSDGWTQDTGHKNPNGEKWDHPESGTSVEWHPGQPGKPGWRGKDHWHVNGGKQHLPPGTDVPDFPGNEGGETDACGEGSECRTIATVLAVGGTAYVIYRCVRMVPSLAPPLWWTIPGNLVTP